MILFSFQSKILQNCGFYHFPKFLSFWSGFGLAIPRSSFCNVINMVTVTPSLVGNPRPLKNRLKRYNSFNEYNFINKQAEFRLCIRAKNNGRALSTSREFYCRSTIRLIYYPQQKSHVIIRQATSIKIIKRATF